MPTSVAVHLQRAKSQMLYDPEDALSQAREAEAKARLLPPDMTRKVALATAMWLRGEAYLRTDQAEAAAPVIDEALRQLEGAPQILKIRGDLLLSLASLQLDRAQAAEALAGCHQAFLIFQKLGDRRSQSRALQTIAQLYEYANDNVQAEKYYRQAGQVYDGDPPLTLTLHNNLGNVLLQLERYSESLSEYKKALNLARQLASPLLKARILGNLARVEIERRNPDEAERFLAEGFRIASSAPEARSVKRQLLAIRARLAFTKGEVERARELIGQTFENAEKSDPSIDNYYSNFIAYQIYAAADDDGKALEHLEIAKRLKDQATKVASSTNASLAAAQFDYKNQELRIANLKAEELRRNVVYERSRTRFQQILFISIGGAALILVVMLGFGLFTIRRSRNEVRAANADLAATNVALERALAAKTEFLATTSHEIRTPLNGILGMTQVMLRDAALAAPTRERIGVIHGAGTTMRALVDDILDVAKMETGNMTVERLPMDLAETLRDVSRMWDEQARGRGLSFDLDLADAPRWIECDPARLRQVVFNLLSNALKFTRAGSIGLRAWSERGDGGEERLMIAVSDTGIGIPHDKQDEIFDSFKQVDAGTTRRYGGTGLGLAICRNLAAALGGTISVASVEGEGATFTLDLPLTRADSPARDAQCPTGGAGDAGLLIVDRNPIARSIFKALLEPRAGTICFVGSAAEAEIELDSGAIRCVLIDEATLQQETDPFAALTVIAEAAEKNSATAAVLWKTPDHAARRAIEASGIKHLIEKPIAGPALAARLFGVEGGDSQAIPPLVSQAA